MDETPKKGSLRGRGKEIMRGFQAEEGESPANPANDLPHFEDEDALLNWLADEEEAAAALMPNDPTGLLPRLDEANQRRLDDLFKEADPDPDFDSIFGDTEEVQAQVYNQQQEAPGSADIPASDDWLDSLEAPAPPAPAEADDWLSGIEEAESIGGTAEEEDWIAGLDAAEVERDLPEALPASLFEEQMATPGVESSWVSDLEAETESPEIATDAAQDASEIDQDFPDLATVLGETDQDTAQLAENELAGLLGIPPISAEAMPAELPHSPEEYESFAPPQRTDSSTSIQSTVMLEDEAAPDSGEYEGQALPVFEREGDSRTVDLSGERLERAAVEALTPDEPETLSAEDLPPDMDAAPTVDEDAAPIATASLSLDEDPAVLGEDAEQAADELYLLEDDEAIPRSESETFIDVLPGSPVDSYGGEESEALSDTGPFALSEEEEAELNVTVTRSGDLSLSGSRLATPFQAREGTQRASARKLFNLPEQQPTDQRLLELLVSDTRIQELYNQIEALHEEVVNSVSSRRGNTDVYQQELLEASNLLGQSREHYDEARAIVYRVRADINRERQVTEDVERYRPLLINTYIGFSIALILLLLLGQMFIGIAEDVGVGWLGQGYYPAIFGAIGALLLSYQSLHQHTTVDRDFDPIHMNWYILNPFVGLLMGFLMYLVFVFTILPSVQLNVTDVEQISSVFRIDVLLAFIAGYNQNVLLSALDAVRQRFTPDRSSATGQQMPRSDEP